MKVQIEQNELIKLEVYREEYKKVMDFLDRKHPDIYNRICSQMLKEIRRDMEELKCLLKK
jgi:transcription antitermination factor NusA-like protein